MAFDGKSLAILVLVGFIVYILFFSPKNSAFRLELEGAPLDGEAPKEKDKGMETKEAPKMMKTTGAEVDSGAGGVPPPSTTQTTTETFTPEVP